MRHKARDSGGKFTLLLLLCRHIGLVRQETGHKFATSSGSKISRFTLPHVIGFVADIFFFSTLENGFKNIRIRCQVRRMRLDCSRIRKEKVADLKISGYVWTGP